jgi:hypothetical protein
MIPLQTPQTHTCSNRNPLAGFPILEINLKHDSRDYGGTPKRSKFVERGGQPFEDSNEFDHPNPVREGRQTFIDSATGLPSASDTTTMGDAPTSTATTTKWTPKEEPIWAQK